MGLTDDPNDPRLHRGVDEEPVGQHDTYLVLSDEERAKGFVRPLRLAYVHTHGERPCGALTTMATPIAETYAANPKFYGATFCSRCLKHLPVEEFTWDGTDERVGS